MEATLWDIENFYTAIDNFEEEMMRPATLIDDNGTCRILLWPETDWSAATYCVYDLRRSGCSHATKSLGHAKKLFRRWTMRSWNARK